MFYIIRLSGYVVGFGYSTLIWAIVQESIKMHACFKYNTHAFLVDIILTYLIVIRIKGSGWRKFNYLTIVANL